MFELFGLIFGGVSRLTQHFMDLKEKQNERDHEARIIVQWLVWFLTGYAVETARKLWRKHGTT
jgi:hypothetical protein